jgi:hypothetical protein
MIEFDDCGSASSRGQMRRDGDAVWRPTISFHYRIVAPMSVTNLLFCARDVCGDVVRSAKRVFFPFALFWPSPLMAMSLGRPPWAQIDAQLNCAHNGVIVVVRRLFVEALLEFKCTHFPRWDGL